MKRTDDYVMLYQLACELAKQKPEVPGMSVALMHGGGPEDYSAWLLMFCGGYLKETGVFDNVWMGFKSFFSMVEPTNLKPLTTKMVLDWVARGCSGNYFETHRKVDFTDLNTFKKAVKICWERGIGHIYIAGGDGSAYHTAQIRLAFAKCGIWVNFIGPLTMDGFYGSDCNGPQSAILATSKCIELFCGGALITGLNGHEAKVASVVQGRDWDTVVAGSAAYFKDQGYIAGLKVGDEVKVVTLPVSVNVDPEKVREIMHKDKKTLFIISEGSPYADETFLKSLVPTEVPFRCQVTGHVSQVPNMLTFKDKCKTTRLAEKIAKKIVEQVNNGANDFSFVWRDGEVIARGPYYPATANAGKTKVLTGFLQEILQEFTP